MEKLSIRIDTGDMDFDRRLARRLCESYEGFMVRLGEGEGQDDIVIGLDHPGPLLPVSELVDRILDDQLITAGKTLYRPKKGLKRVFLFYSPHGGSGLSSVAFVFSRLLSIREGERVLYIDCGIPGSFPYTEGDLPTRPLEELVFIIRSGRDLRLSEYLSEDHYGVKVLFLREIDQEILKMVSDRAEADSIVISKREAMDLPGITNIPVFNAKDSRITEEMRLMGSEGLKVINREYVNREEGDRILIAEDGLSFKNPDGRSVISMDGNFSLGVERIIRWIER